MCEHPCQRCPSSPIHKSASCVWHSLSACGFADLAPKQLGSIGCHIRPPAAVKDGKARDECCNPPPPPSLSLCYKTPLKPQGIWTHGASSISKPHLRKQLTVRSWNKQMELGCSAATCVCEVTSPTMARPYDLCFRFIVWPWVALMTRWRQVCLSCDVSGGGGPNSVGLASWGVRVSFSRRCYIQHAHTPVT